MVAVVNLLPAANSQPHASQFGTDRYIEYIPGELPIILTSPHGGRLRPEALADRKSGVTDADLNSQELARAIADRLQATTGHRPHLIVSHLHRRKLDPNREIKEAAGGDPKAERAWREFHDFIRTATTAAAAEHGFGFLIDIHGHSHPLPRLELGYGLTGAQLNQSDRAFNASDFASISTVRDLRARNAKNSAELIRGPRSLGALFVAAGIRAVPSPAEPGPGPGPFFSGGYHRADSRCRAIDPKNRWRTVRVLQSGHPRHGGKPRALRRGYR
jgi:N-formylglutamate amidohydrolase